jgi:hypothetical protein
MLDGVTAEDEHQISYQALPRGVPVYAADGALVGRVHRVLDNAREHIFDGIVIATDSGKRFVDAPEVVRITSARVTLSIDAAEAARLPAQPGVVGGIEARAGRLGRRWRRRFGGR